METNQTQPRVVLTNAFAMSMLKNPREAIVQFRRISLEELRELARYNVVNYIRHPSTLSVVSDIIGRQLEVNSGNYVYHVGDVIIMITLATPQRGQEAQVKPEDLVVYQISVRHLE